MLSIHFLTHSARYPDVQPDKPISGKRLVRSLLADVIAQGIIAGQRDGSKEQEIHVDTKLPSGVDSALSSSPLSGMFFHHITITMLLILNVTSLDVPPTQDDAKKKAKSSSDASSVQSGHSNNITATRRAETSQAEKKAASKAKRAVTLAKKKEQQTLDALAKEANKAATPVPATDKGKKPAAKGSNKEVKSQKGTKKRPRTDTASGGSPCQCTLRALSLQSLHLTIPFSPQEIKGRPIS